jgi:hypothetical protein
MVEPSASREGDPLPAWTPSWITHDLIEQTRKLFESRYKASLCLEQVVRILQRVGTLLDVVLHPQSLSGELAS